ncbi:MAG: hypothetical protein RL008_799 [Actinomycetota bacterium]|jgi:hypothetical protein
MAIPKQEGALTLTQLTRPAKNQNNPISPPLLVNEKHLGLADGVFRSVIQGNIDNIPDIILNVEVIKDSNIITGDIAKLQVGNILKISDKIVGKVVEIATNKTSATLESPVTTIESGAVAVTISPGKRTIDLITIESTITPREQLLVLEVKAIFGNQTKVMNTTIDIDQLYSENQIERV